MCLLIHTCQRKALLNGPHFSASGKKNGRLLSPCALGDVGLSVGWFVNWSPQKYLNYWINSHLILTDIMKDHGCILFAFFTMS